MNKLLKVITILILSSCAPGYIVTTNLHNLATFEPNSQIYTLPKTRMIVTINSEKTEFVPGPYHAYAKKLLGIENVKASPEEKYRITNIEVNTQSIPDPDYCYSLRNENYGDVGPLLNNFRERGLIMHEVNHNYVKPKTTLKQNECIEQPDLIIHPFLEEEIILKQEFEKQDYLAIQFEAKTLEQKAQIAAKFIFKVRKRRFKLLAGQYAVYPVGNSLQVAMDELSRIEQAYISLFTGKTVSSKHAHNFTVLPNEYEDIQRFALTRFSDTEGIVPTESNIGEAIIIELKALESNATLSQLRRAGISTENENTIYYRLPERTNIKVLYGSHEVLVVEKPIFQFGTLLPQYIPPKKGKLF